MSIKNGKFKQKIHVCYHMSPCNIATLQTLISLIIWIILKVMSAAAVKILDSHNMSSMFSQRKLLMYIIRTIFSSSLSSSCIFLTDCSDDDFVTCISDDGGILNQLFSGVDVTSAVIPYTPALCS